MKLGSLFSGIGGFEFVAQRHGITPVWASEVDTICISITKRYFPDMKHLGDITKINGAAIEPVDIISFGSPCQDLSVAGKRAGLEGARSGLFNHAIRIINEMRGITNEIYPRFAIWENVPGALSSSNGLDFKAVLQFFTGCEIPMPDSGRWANAGMVRGGRCDIAWRILDAQYWGVPQRRRRIFLVADFRGERAAEVLFKPESLRRDFTQGGTQGQEIAGSAGSGVTDAVAYAISGNIIDRMPENGGNGLGVRENVAPTLTTIDRHAVFDCRGDGDGKTSCTLTGDHQNRVTDYTAITFSRQSFHEYKTDGVSSTQTASHKGADSSPALICVSDTQRDAKICVDLAPALTCMHEQPYVTGSIVRRLTPVECERLQGFPDNWTAFDHDGKPVSDTKRYAAVGNSVAVPCVDYIMQGIIDLTPMTGK